MKLKKNVKNIDTNSLNEGVNLFEATIVLNRLLPIKNIVIKKKVANLIIKFFKFFENLINTILYFINIFKFR